MNDLTPERVAEIRAFSSPARNVVLIAEIPKRRATMRGAIVLTNHDDPSSLFRVMLLHEQAGFRELHVADSWVYGTHAKAMAQVTRLLSALDAGGREFTDERMEASVGLDI